MPDGEEVEGDDLGMDEEMSAPSRLLSKSRGDHMVDLSGDWWRSEADGGAFEDCPSASISFEDFPGAGRMLISRGGAVSGSMKSVWRERSQRTTLGGQEGP